MTPGSLGVALDLHMARGSTRVFTSNFRLRASAILEIIPQIVHMRQ